MAIQVRFEITKIQVSQILITVRRRVKTPKQAESLYDANVRFLALVLQVRFGLDRVLLPGLETIDERIVGECSSEGDQCVMQHWGVVWGLDCVGRYDGPVHITEKQGRDDTEAPGCKEAEEEVEDLIMLVSSKGEIRWKVTRPIK